MLNALWLAATLAQAALLAAYWRAGLWRKWPWFVALYGFLIAGSGILALAGPRNGARYGWTFFALTLALQFFRVMAALEAINGTNGYAKRHGIRDGLLASAVFIGLSMLGGKWTLLKLLRSGTQTIATVFFCVLGAAVVVPMRDTGRAAVVSRHAGILLAILALDIGRKLIANAGWCDPGTGDVIGQAGSIVVNLTACWLVRGRA